MTDTQQSPIGMQLIQAERERQIKAEGWTDRHDNQFDIGVLEAAGEYYIQGGAEGCKWPFENPPKLKDQRDNYIRGGALLMAEVDRIQRRLYPNTCSFDVRNRDSEGVIRLRKRIQWVADRLDGKPTPQEIVAKLETAAAESYPAFVRAAWMQPTVKDYRSKQIAALGLMGEAGEVCEVIKKRVRGDEGAHVSDEKLLLELGDVWFYFNLMAMQWGFDLELTALPIITQSDFAWCVYLMENGSKLVGWVAEIMAGMQVGASNGQLREMRPATTAIIIAIKGLCHNNKCIDLHLLEQANVKKLCDRYRNNGTLRGTGSDR